VGTALGLRLAGSGHHVFGLRRDASDLPEPIHPVSADLLDPETLVALPPGIEYVVYCASAGGFDPLKYRNAYVTGLQNLLAALKGQGQQPRRIVFTSSTGVYAQSGGELVTENSPAESMHFSGATLLTGERILRESPFPSTVVRLGGIYGPGRNRTIEDVRSGRATMPRDPVFSNLIHRDDCAGILAHVVDMAHPADLYIGVDHEPVDRRELLLWLADRLGVDPPPEAEPPSSGRLQRSNKRCSSARIRSAKYRFLFPTFREGMAQLIDK
jgi:nucleoside-diphosphate-sugar epimerase